MISVAALAISGADALAAAQCEAILQYGARETSVEASKHKISSSYYSRHCEGSTASASSQTDVGFMAMISGNFFDIDVGTGSTSDKANNFCKSYSDSKDRRDELYRNVSTVNAQALTSFVDCAKLSVEGVAFSPTLSRTVVNLDIQRTTGAKLTLTGFAYDEQLLECTGQNRENQRVPLKSVAPIELADNQMWTAICTRKPQSAGDVVFYPDATLSVATSQSSFLLPISADALHPRQWATDFESELVDIRKEVQAIPRSFDLVCDKIDLASGQAGYPEVVVPIPPNTVLTGGGCETTQFDYPGQGGHNAVMLKSRPTSDGRGWQCKAGDPPGVPLKPVITAYAIFCKIGSTTTTPVSR
jgi:hypothetical protein